MCLGDRYQEGEEIFTNFQAYLKEESDGLAAVAKIHPLNFSQDRILSGTNAYLDEENRILASLIRFPHKSKLIGNWYLTGIFILKPSFWKALEETRKEHNSEKAFSKTLGIMKMIKQGAKIKYVKEEGITFNINTLRDFLTANLYLAKRKGIL